MTTVALEDVFQHRVLEHGFFGRMVLQKFKEFVVLDDLRAATEGAAPEAVEAACCSRPG